MKLESKAQLNSLRMSPQKVRLVVDLIRGMHVQDASAQLQFSRKAAAKPLYTLLQSAIANAVHNHKMDTATLVISSIFVNEGTVLKRWMPRAQGRATPLRKRSSHITLVLTGEGTTQSSSKEASVSEEVSTVDAPAETKKTKAKKTTTKTSTAKKPRAKTKAQAS